jgi:integrase
LSTAPRFPYFSHYFSHSARPLCRDMAGRRLNREGSVYQRASDGFWIGYVHFGYDDRGRRVRKYVSAKTKDDALRKLRALSRDRDDGMPAPAGRTTVEELLRAWFDEELRSRVVRTTADNYRSVFEHHVLPALGRKPVASLTLSDVNRLLVSKLDQGLSPSTVQRIRNVLSQALDYGVRQGIVARNVAALTRGPRNPRPEGRTLTPEQARTLLVALEGHPHEALFVLMLTTGLRRGEALGLRWEDVDFELGVLRVRRALKREGGTLVTAEPKTSRSRRAVNLPAPLLDLLHAHRGRQKEAQAQLRPVWIDPGFVFTSEIGSPFDPRNLNRTFHAVCRSAGIGRWHPHELRHSVASLMLAQGVPIQVVADVLGHASIRMTADVYGHVLAPDRRAAADAMGAVLWSKDSHP